MSLRPTAIALEKSGTKGMCVVIDDPGTTGVLLIPCSFQHRHVVTRSELGSDFEVHPARAVVTLTKAQRRVLEEIGAMEASGEDGHNLSGDLSWHTGNLTLTMRRLEARGLVEGTYAPMAMEGEEWTYNLTEPGKQAIAQPPQGGDQR